MSAWLGYDNSAGATTIPIGANNFFSPGAIDLGQPENFATGHNDFAVRVSFHQTGSMTQLTWFLDGNTVTVNGAASGPACNPASWAGNWIQPPHLQYVLGDIVIHNGASWIVTGSADATEPGVGAGWTELGSLSGGPTGPAGPVGPQGIPGPRGPQGPAGDQVTFPTAVTRTFPHTGRFLIRDPHVGPASVVTIEYMGTHGRPTSVDKLTTGSFVATGTPGRHFRYVVFNQP